MLKNHADAAAHFAQTRSIARGNVFAANQDAATRGLFQQVDMAHQRRFARAGVADNAKDLARLDLEVDAVKGGNIAPVHLERLVDINKFNHSVTLWVCYRGPSRTGDGPRHFSAKGRRARLGVSIRGGACAAAPETAWPSGQQTRHCPRAGLDPANLSFHKIMKNGYEARAARLAAAPPGLATPCHSTATPGSAMAKRRQCSR